MSGSWEPDPGGRHQLRWWDGTRWTDHVSDQGQTTTDPLTGPVEAVPAGPPQAPTPPAAPTASSPPATPSAGASVFDSEATQQITLPPSGPAVSAPPPTVPLPTVPPTPNWPGTPPPTVAGPASPPPGFPPGPPSGPTGPAGGGSGGPRKGIVAVVAVALAAALGAGAFFLLGGDDDDNTATEDSSDDDTSDESSDDTTDENSDDDTSDDGSDESTTTAAPETTTTAVPETTTTAPPETTTTANDTIESVGANSASYFEVTLQTAQAFRYRVLPVEGTESDLVVTIVGQRQATLDAAALSTAFVGQAPDAIAATLETNTTIEVPGITADEIALYQTDRTFGGEADWFIAPYTGTYFISVQEFSLAAADFTIEFESGEITTVDIFTVNVDDPAVSGPFYTDPAYYGS